MERFDLIAIGGGTAGLVTAAGAASLGLRAALVERDALGGDCLWTGCVPSKALIASARLAHQMRHAERLGLTGASPAHVFAHVMDRMRSVRSRVGEHDDPERFRKLGIEVVFGEARLAASNRVTVEDRSLMSKRIVVATGSSSSVPPIPGLEDVGYLTHATAFEQNALPGRIAILGGGPIGLEFAQIYSRLGAEVVVFEMLPQLLPREDREAAETLGELLAAEGVKVHTGARVERVEGGEGASKIVNAVSDADGRLAATVDELFVATGRRSNGDGLGLEAAGVEVERGVVKVDRTLRSSVPGIWAAGDVTGDLQFTHVADYQAKLVLRNSVFPFSSRQDLKSVPRVTYTDPEIAHVGLTESEARLEHRRVEVYRYDFADLDRAIVDGGELIVPLVLAMKEKMPLGKLSRIVYPYPTMAEGVKRTADGYYRAKLAGQSGTWLRKVVRWLA
jgi:pyruvate/2-oxoglutarate dehydrogenase complex dihydrolipoamide dehydrogenase (E3) component